MNLDEALKAAADLEESRQGSLAADCDLDEGYEPHRSVMDALKFFSEREPLVQALLSLAHGPLGGVMLPAGLRRALDAVSDFKLK